MCDLGQFLYFAYLFFSGGTLEIGYEALVKVGSVGESGAFGDSVVVLSEMRVSPEGTIAYFSGQQSACKRTPNHGRDSVVFV